MARLGLGGRQLPGEGQRGRPHGGQGAGGRGGQRSNQVTAEMPGWAGRGRGRRLGVGGVSRRRLSVRARGPWSARCAVHRVRHGVAPGSADWSGAQERRHRGSQRGGPAKEEGSLSHTEVTTAWPQRAGTRGEEWGWGWAAWPKVSLWKAHRRGSLRRAPQKQSPRRWALRGSGREDTEQPPWRQGRPYSPHTLSLLLLTPPTPSLLQPLLRPELRILPDRRWAGAWALRRTRELRATSSQQVAWVGTGHWCGQRHSGHLGGHRRPAFTEAPNVNPSPGPGPNHE